MSSPSQVIVLAEDRRQQNFVSHFLKELDYSSRDIRKSPLPASRGSGEQWVREHYAQEVAACRARAGGRRAATALIVVVDADTTSIEERRKRFMDSLVAAGEAPIRPQDVVVHFIPKRNRETWITFLNGAQANEEDNYKPRVCEDDIRPAALRFHEVTRPNAQHPPGAPPSLSAAIPEARRIERKS